MGLVPPGYGDRHVDDPEVPAGATAVIDVSELTLKLARGVEPKLDGASRR